ncbi:MAG: hypothetical protein M3R44_02655 [Candidatus Eremiobacteraeota bacterium]|nr:hypothetical protein [Candidatus Eremiobacteraeota bacterium]
MEVRRAFADLAEVRGRLAGVQRFDGYSGTAAMASGLVALGAGVLQALVDPYPRGDAERHTYLLIWLSCLGIALVLNYGAIVFWRSRNRGEQAGVQFRTVGMSIIPALAAGGVITGALVQRGLDALLPGMWCATYALGLFASRAMVPRQVVAVAVAFGAIAAALLLIPAFDPLAWWIMPVAFGGGQIAIGAIVRTDARIDDNEARI